MNFDFARRTLRAALPGFVAAATLMPAGASAADSDHIDACIVHQLGQGGQVEAATSAATGGRWLSGFSITGTESTMLVWHGRDVRVPVVPIDYASLSAINRHGTVVGAGTEFPGEIDNRTVAFAEADGEFIRLGTPAGTLNAYPAGISNGGVVGGTATTYGEPSVAVTWTLDRPDLPDLLRVPRGFAAETVDVSGRGRVGVVATKGGSVRSFVFGPRGKRSELDSIVPGSQVELLAVADEWAIAVERQPGGEPTVVRYNLAGDTVDAIDLPGATPSDINDDGTFVGNDIDGPFVYTDRLARLPSISEGGQAKVFALDNQNGPAGSSELSVNNGVAVKWTC